MTVAPVLDDLARRGLEPGGSVCVVRGGEVLLEHCVGTRDGDAPWDTETLVMTYSVAKPFAALTVLSALADEAVDLDRRIGDLWPAYASHGKEATTIRQVLAHQAGLPCFPQAAAEVPYDDFDSLTALLATATPDHEPGTAVAEHALTYGHLCDVLVRAVTGEPLATRFARIADSQDWDLFLTEPKPALDRTADVVALDPGWPADYLADPRWGPALGRPGGLLDPDVLNSRRWRTTSFPAIGLHASARALATFYDDLGRADGAVADLLGPDLHAAYVGAAASGHDRVLDRDVVWTLGFQLDEGEVGMGGAGGCSAWRSTTDGYGAAYVSRGLGSHERGDAVWDAINRQLSPGG